MKIKRATALDIENARLKEKMRKDIPREVIEENVKRVVEGGELTMPLSMLDGRLKDRLRRCLKTPEEIEQQKKRSADYYENHKEKLKDYHKKVFKQ
jgi:hypothetical protein